MPTIKNKPAFLTLLSDQFFKWLFITQGLPWQLNPRTGVLLIGIVLAWVWWQFRGRSGSAWLLAGGLSNLIDRIFKGGVIDYFQLFGIWFNLADLMIVGGLVAVVYSSFNESKSRF